VSACRGVVVVGEQDVDGLEWRERLRPTPSLTSSVLSPFVRHACQLLSNSNYTLRAATTDAISESPAAQQHADAGHSASAVHVLGTNRRSASRSTMSHLMSARYVCAGRTAHYAQETPFTPTIMHYHSLLGSRPEQRLRWTTRLRTMTRSFALQLVHDDTSGCGVSSRLHSSSAYAI
jgi:hypothetical protein